MDKNLAVAVMASVKRLGENLNEIDRLVEELQPEAERENFRRSLGGIMADVYIKLMKPIITDHPELDPDGKEISRPIHGNG